MNGAEASAKDLALETPRDKHAQLKPCLRIDAHAGPTLETVQMTTTSPRIAGAYASLATPEKSS